MSAFARGAVSSTTLETAFSKVVLLLPQLWGKGASVPGAIEHYEPLETSFFVENPRGDAYRHLEVLVNHPNSVAPEHSPPPQLSLLPPTPAQSAVPPTASSPGVAHESAGSGVVRQAERADMEVSPGFFKVFPEQKLTLYPPSPAPGFDSHLDNEILFSPATVKSQ